MARSTGHGRGIISRQELDWRALISGRVSGQRIIPSPMAIEPWGLPPPDIITSSGSKGSWLGLKSSPFVAFPASLYATSFWWDVGEVIVIIQVRLRECLRLLVRGSMGHAIKVVQVWHLRLIVMRLKERNKILASRMNCMNHEANHIPNSRQNWIKLTLP